jgi:hypothetical protein
MKKEDFEELMESVRQGGAIMKGKMKPSRSTEFPESEVRGISERYGLSQDKVVDRSDTWNEQDQRDLAAVSLKYAAEFYPEDEELVKSGRCGGD